MQNASDISLSWQFTTFYYVLLLLIYVQDLCPSLEFRLLGDFLKVLVYHNVKNTDKPIFSFDLCQLLIDCVTSG